VFVLNGGAVPHKCGYSVKNVNLATGHTGLGQGGGNEITKCCYVPPNQGPRPVLASFPARLRLAVGAMEGGGIGVTQSHPGDG
jgi:hypothetical protein